MRTRNHQKFFTISAFMSLAFMLLSCASTKNREELIVGEWNAEWETLPGSQGTSSENSLSYNMTGKVIFRPDGSVDVVGYGYPGCVFSSDTLKNQLRWTLEAGSLNMQNTKDHFDLRYSINELKEGELRLTLMEDITLRLKRNQ